MIGGFVAVRKKKNGEKGKKKMYTWYSYQVQKQKQSFNTPGKTQEPCKAELSTKPKPFWFKLNSYIATVKRGLFNREQQQYVRTHKKQGWRRACTYASGPSIALYSIVPVE